MHPLTSLQTAAAKVLGLMALRVADDLVLPHNITHYSFELSSYLHKVASIAESMDVADQLEFAGLKESIRRVQNASVALDRQAAAALDRLHRLVPHSPRGDEAGLARAWENARRLVMTAFGGEHHDESHPHRHGHHHKGHHHHAHPRPDPKKVKEIRKILREIRGINQKLAGYEAGYVSPPTHGNP